MAISRTMPKMRDIKVAAALTMPERKRRAFFTGTCFFCLQAEKWSRLLRVPHFERKPELALTEQFQQGLQLELGRPELQLELGRPELQLELGRPELQLSCNLLGRSSLS